MVVGVNVELHQSGRAFACGGKQDFAVALAEMRRINGDLIEPAGGGINDDETSKRWRVCFKKAERLRAGGFEPSDLLRQPIATRIEINVWKGDAPGRNPQIQ